MVEDLLELDDEGREDEALVELIVIHIYKVKGHGSDRGVRQRSSQGVGQVIILVTGCHSLSLLETVFIIRCPIFALEYS